MTSRDLWAMLSWMLGGASGIFVGGYFFGLVGAAIGLIVGVSVGHLILPFDTRRGTQ